MAGTAQRFEGPGTIAYNGRVLAKATKMSVSIDTKANDVEVMRGGWVGESEGPMSTEITTDNAIPLVGLEVDFWNLLVNHKPVAITFVVGRKRITSTGFLRKIDLSQDVNSPANISVSFKGGVPDVRG